MRKHPALLSAVILGVISMAVLSAPSHVASQIQTSQLTEDQKAGARVDIARKKAQLDEYHKGKMSMRDGYQLMRGMLIDYALLGEATSSEAQKIQKDADALETRYPKVVHEQAEEPAYVPPKRKPFAPKDIHVMGIWGSDHKIAVAYQYRIEFFHLPDDVFFSDFHGNAVFTRKTTQGDAKIDLDSLGLKSVAKLTFKRHVDVRPGTNVVDKRLLICTSLIWGYTPKTDEERSYLPQDGLPYFRWEEPSGKYADFCGVVSLDGEVVWKLDYKQSLPNHLLYPVDILPDGNKALICSGSQAYGSEGAEYVANLKDLFVWEYPNKVKKLKASDHGTTPFELFGVFRAGKL